VKYKIPVADPYIASEDAAAVANSVREKKLSQGEYVQKFEEEFASYIGVKHAVAVCNGTAALHVALAAIGLEPNMEVLVPSFSFAATANCVLFQNAKPVFVDIDPLTYNIDPSSIEAKITRKTKAIIAMHYAGHPADMDTIREIAVRYRLFVIEDAAEAHGALYKDRKVGSLGQMSCFSFYPNKNMTTGEGGMIATDDTDLAGKMRMIRSHGQDRTYHHIILGYNYRMSDILAALGRVQLKRLDRVIKRKGEKATYYNRKLNEIFGDDVRTPYVAPYATHTYMFYSIRLTHKNIRDKVAIKLRSKSVETRIAFPPIHLQPLYRNIFRYTKGYLPVTEEVSDTILSIPIYPHITQKEQDYVILSIGEVLK